MTDRGKRISGKTSRLGPDRIWAAEPLSMRMFLQ